MKTSNKLLLIALAIILTGTILFILKIKQLSNIGQVELSGKIAEKTQIISDFENLQVEGGINVTIQKSDTNSLTFEADTTILNHISVDQIGNNLVIKMKISNLKYSKVEASLKTKNLDITKFDLSAGADVNTLDTIRVSEMSLDLSAGAHAKLPVICNSVQCNTSAGASADLSGKTKTFKAESSAGAQLIADKLVADEASADASAGGYILLNVVNSLDVKCSAGGTVRYTGRPDMRNIDISSGGNLSKAE
jgi:hypothetical protein